MLSFLTSTIGLDAVAGHEGAKTLLRARLIAAFECTSRRLLPTDLAALPHEKIAERLTELRAVLGERRMH